MGKRRCVFFDRDGIVNAEPGPGRYVLAWKEFCLLPAFVAALAIVRRRGYEAAIATNQRCVARGLVRLETIRAIHRRLRERLRKEAGLDLLDIAVCPHDKDVCVCRKPAPGLLHRLARRHGIDLAASWMVGDKETDVEAGRRAGCRTIRVSAAADRSSADWRVASMDELPALLERVLDPGAEGSRGDAGRPSGPGR